MNRFGQQMLQHYQDHRPQELATLTDPQSHFTRLGQQLEQSIEDLARDKAGQAPPQESYLQRVRRLTTARAEAESEVMRAHLQTT